MMSLSDPKYLLGEQYKDAENLDARIALHARFSVNKQGWHPWVFDQFDFPQQCMVLQLGCGPCYLWAENLLRVPGGWDITLSDFSPGMLEEGRTRLGEEQGRFRFALVDAQAIPYEDETFDAVIASHMLYHVPDRRKALSEIRRVLKRGGCLYATTVGRNHLRELYELVRRVDSEGEMTWWHEEIPFTLESGGEQMAPWFSDVEVRRYDDDLVVTEVEPLLAYMLSSSGGQALTGSSRAALRALVEQEIAASGAIHITKDSGMFVAVRRTE
jgi:ubiquinone/menaquinone biosynthesis C-methylase UbiE